MLLVKPWSPGLFWWAVIIGLLVGVPAAVGHYRAMISTSRDPEGAGDPGPGPEHGMAPDG